MPVSGPAAHEAFSTCMGALLVAHMVGAVESHRRMPGCVTHSYSQTLPHSGFDWPVSCSWATLFCLLPSLTQLSWRRDGVNMHDLPFRVDYTVCISSQELLPTGPFKLGMVGFLLTCHTVGLAPWHSAGALLPVSAGESALWLCRRPRPHEGRKWPSFPSTAQHCAHAGCISATRKGSRGGQRGRKEERVHSLTEARPAPHTYGLGSPSAAPGPFHLGYRRKTQPFPSQSLGTGYKGDPLSLPDVSQNAASIFLEWQAT